MTPTKVFLDSSAIISELASDKGGSLEVLALSELGILIPYISEDIVREVFRNVQKKLPSQVDRYHTLIKALSVNYPALKRAGLAGQPAGPVD